jgi:5'-nucleotidase
MVITPRLLLTTVSTSMLLAVAAQPAAAHPTKTPRDLRILVTNDDGWIGAGGVQTPLIVKLRDALKAAGHDVTVVAPAGDQSGTGTQLTFRTPLQLANPETGVWTVSGTPGDSVFLGLDTVFSQTRPDLVVSGINPGGNYSSIANHSGTVGAAIAALEAGIPSMAVSIDGDATQSAAKGDAVAAYAARLVDRLTVAGRGTVLPKGLGLNVNYPGKVDAPTGEQFTKQDDGSYFALKYLNLTGAPGMPGTYRFVGGAPTATAQTGSDWAAIDAGRISITPIDADRTAAPARASRLPRLGK